MGFDSEQRFDVGVPVADELVFDGRRIFVVVDGERVADLSELFIGPPDFTAHYEHGHIQVAGIAPARAIRTWSRLEMRAELEPGKVRMIFGG